MADKTSETIGLTNKPVSRQGSSNQPELRERPSARSGVASAGNQPNNSSSSSGGGGGGGNRNSASLILNRQNSFTFTRTGSLSKSGSRRGSAAGGSVSTAAAGSFTIGPSSPTEPLLNKRANFIRQASRDSFGDASSVRGLSRSSSRSSFIKQLSGKGKNIDVSFKLSA